MITLVPEASTLGLVAVLGTPALMNDSSDCRLAPGDKPRISTFWRLVASENIEPGSLVNQSVFDPPPETPYTFGRRISVVPVRKRYATAVSAPTPAGANVSRLALKVRTTLSLTES